MTHFGGTDVALLLSVFVASAVEAVEAVTIILAAGIARHMRSSLQGALSALVLLVALVAAFGPAINNMPKNTLRLVIGSILLLFGLQWLRKAILRYSGVIAIHDEARIYKEEVEKSAGVAVRSKFIVHDWYAFVMSFKGVLLEGLEVIFIVISFADARSAQNHHAFIESAAAALAAAVLAIGIGLVAHKPLTTVPENTMKYGVGLMLTSFGFFWSVEGLGITWPQNELDIIWILIALFVVTQIAVRLVKSSQPTRAKQYLLFTGLEDSKSFLGRTVYFWYDFLIGDDWRMALLVGAALIVGHFVHFAIALVAIAIVVALGLASLLPL